MNIDTDQLPPTRAMSEALRTDMRRELEREVVAVASIRKWVPRVARPKRLAIGIALGVAVASGGAAAAANGGWLNSSGVPIAKPPPMQREDLPAGAYDGQPLNVPSGPQTSVGDCPQDPQWSPPLPAGATVTVSLVPAGPEGVSLNGRFESVAGFCAYTVTLPGRSSGTTVVGK